jgi:vacuolar-type H+-ATPase subunit I/STV1
MLPMPTKQEIDHRTLKLLVGLIALTLGHLTSLFAHSEITSISAAYHQGGWSQSILIGFLFAIAAFLLAYNGLSKPEMLLSKVAAVAALGVALFPCACDGHTEVVPYVHAGSAAVMFLILTYFCYVFYRRARAKGHTEANRRAVIYAVCGLTIVASILILVLNTITGGVLVAQMPRLVFYCEQAGLVAFGASWLTASRILPVLTNKNERFSPLRADATPAP